MAWSSTCYLELKRNQSLCVIAISDQESIFSIGSSLSKRIISTNIQYMTLPCFIHCDNDITNCICNKKSYFHLLYRESVQRVVLYSPEHRLASRPEKKRDNYWKSLHKSWNGSNTKCYGWFKVWSLNQQGQLLPKVDHYVTKH